MSTLRSSPPFDPAEPAPTTTSLDTGSGRLNQYSRQSGGQLFSTPQTQVYVYADSDNDGREVVIKAVKRHNATRDKFQMLRRNHQARKGDLLSTEQSIHREIAIMKSCRHANIVRLLEVVDDPRKDKVYMVMEYLRGGKIQWQDENKAPTLTVAQTRRIFRDLVCGLEYLHYLGIVHRDIKPDNLVWSDNRAHVKIIDYGISHFSPFRRKVPFARWRKSLDPLKETSLFPPADLLRLRGTEYFIAPEVVWVSGEESLSSATSSNTVTAESAGSHSAPSSVSGHDSPHGNGNAAGYSTPQSGGGGGTPRPISRPPITKAIDIWSLGVTLYCLLFGCLPFNIPRTANQHPNHARFILYHEICTKDWVAYETMGADKVPVGGRHPTDPKSVISLLDRMLQKNPKERITLDDIKRHPWLLEDLPNPSTWLVDTSPANYYMPKPYVWVRRIVNRIFSV